MPLPTTLPQSYPNLLTDIERGEIKIPQFQRKFVWSVPQTARLMDSLIKGYPIGAFIFWQTKERLRVVRSLGGIEFPTPPAGEFVSYVLDGQQRLTSIYACMKGAKIGDDDYSKIFVDLEASAESGEDIVVLDETPSCMKMTELTGGDFKLLNEYDEKYPGKIREYQNNLNNYPFSVIQYRDTDINVATEIFTRINVGGKPLTTFEIMVARTYDSEREFDLRDQFDALVKELEEVDYETIPEETVLQVAAAILSRECRRKTILQLPKGDFIDGWCDITAAIKHAVDFFRKELCIPVSQLLPYNALLVPLAYFFYKNGNKRLTPETRKRLCDFFWQSSLLERYSGAVESNLGQDIKKMEEIHNGILPSYEEKLPLTSEWLMEHGHFSTSRSFIKAILCLYASFKPLSFDNGLDVSIGNDYLQQSNSRNYHHFFPKSYLQKQGRHDEHMINHVLNITIVDAQLNKSEIRAKKPSVYMKKFRGDNPDTDINATMRTHLIDDLEKFGVFDDDYDAFLRERAKRVIAEIRKRVIEQ